MRGCIEIKKTKKIVMLLVLAVIVSGCQTIPDGQSTYTYSDGAKYVGEFRNGQPSGQGTFTHTYSNKYVGEFKDDKPHGQGTRTYADGRIEEGVWKAGKFQYTQKVTPPVIARKKPRSTPRRRTDASAFLRLKKLKSLFDAGLITPEEFKDKKTVILKSF